MLSIRDYSITRKLTWMNMLASSTALLLACVSFTAYETVLYRRTLQRDLSVQSQIIGSNSVSAVLFNDPRSAEGTLAALRAAPRVTSAWIFTPDGKPFAGYGRDEITPAPKMPPIPAGQAETYWFNGSQLELIHPVIFQQKLTAIVYIQSDLGGLYDRLERFVEIGAGVMLASLLAAFLVSWISRRVIAKPIQDLSDTARLVSRDKNYAVRAAPTESRDEISVLIDAFNGMLAQIQQRDDALRKAQEQFNLALMSAGVGTWSADLANQVITPDDLTPLLFGLKPGAFSLRPDDLLRMIHPDDREGLAQWNTKPLETEGLLETEFRVIWPDGTVHALRARGKLYRDDAGHAARLTGVCWDITERKRVEEALIEERYLLHTLMDNLPDGIYFKDRHSRFTRVNKAHANAFGLSDPAQAAGKTDFDFFTTEHAQDAYDDELRIMETGQPVIGKEEKETWQDGRETWVSSTKMPMRDASGMVVGTFGISHGITGLKRAELQIRKLNDELEERVRERTEELEAANKELEAFTYSVSHDLRAPLRHVDGFSKLLVEKHSAELSPDALDYVATIRDSAVHMGMLIDDLLNLARVGRKQLTMQVTGLNSLAEEVMADLKRANPDRLIEWKVATLPFVECDPALVKQVFVNLLSNAVKFTRPRKPAVIELGVAAHNGDTAVFVRDNGVGFSMKYANKLFGVFQRLHRSEDFEGTGVGLATVQRIIHKHGGRVWAEAGLDKGATFYFTMGSQEDPKLEKAKGSGGKP